MSNIDFNQLRDRAYQCACNHGFHQLELSNEHFLMLVITELSEAVEADRKGWCAHPEPFLSIVNSRTTISDDKWKEAFETYIKNSVEDELTDAVIRLLDMAGLRNISIEPFNVKIDTKKSIPEHCYEIASIITKYPLEEAINSSLGYLFSLADHLEINLPWHIEQKMKYNQLREQKHGKNY